MIKRLLGNLSGWMVAGLLGLTIFAGMQARNYALQLSATEARLARAHDQVAILQEHQRWQREQMETLSAVLSARDEQIQRDDALVNMMRDTARQLERDDATTHDWASQPLPAAVREWVRDIPRGVTVPMVVIPEVPAHLVTPLNEPERRVSHNRDLLQLLADYESLRRRANADRAAVHELFLKPGSAGENL